MKNIPGTEYISKNASGYMIQKYNKETHRMEYFYSTTSLISALMVRDLFVANNWNKDCVPKKETITGEKYIYPDAIGYCIRKIIDGKNTHFGWFRTLEEAIIERDLLIECDWDFERLCNLPIENEEWLIGKYGKNQFHSPVKGRVDIRSW